MRGGCTPGNSRRVAARDKSRLWQLASLVLIERPAHVRGGCTPGNSRRVAARDKSRLGQLAVARAHREASARARGLHPRQFAARGRAGQVAPVAARFARAHREASARPRRSASAVTSRGLHPGQFAARGRAGQVAPWAARCRSCSSNRQRTCAAECLRCHFAPWAARFARAHRTTNARARPSAWAVTSWGLHPGGWVSRSRRSWAV